MALTKCKECGREVSDLASSCPHCQQSFNVPGSQQTFVAGAKTILVSLWQRTLAANQIIGRYVAIAKMKAVTVPGCYKALGEQSYKDGKFQAEFPEDFREINGMLAKVAAIKAKSEQRPKAERLSDRARTVAAFVRERLTMKRLQGRLNSAYGQLGKAVFAKHGEQSGSTELVPSQANPERFILVPG
jgi:hypothetical protein